MEKRIGPGGREGMEPWEGRKVKVKRRREKGERKKGLIFPQLQKFLWKKMIISFTLRHSNNRGTRDTNWTTGKLLVSPNERLDKNAAKCHSAQGGTKRRTINDEHAQNVIWWWWWWWRWWWWETQREHRTTKATSFNHTTTQRRHGRRILICKYCQHKLL